MDNEISIEEQQDLVTAQEAREIFTRAGLSAATFHRRVGAGLIDSIMPQGRQRGALYPRNQVLAAIGEKAKKPKKKRKSISNLKPSIFSRATPADMPDIAPLLISFYTQRISIEKRAAWIERNPDIAYMLKSEGKVVGCAFIMPLSEEKIFQILSSQVKPPTRPAEIALYEPGKHVHLYVRAVGVLQSVSKAQRKHWAARLIKGLARAVIQLGSKGIFIDKIYAQGDTKAGEHALRMLGFSQIEINASTSRKNYMLDVQKSGSVWAMKYKHTLNTWRAYNEEE
jgi:hypothetical protein